MRGSGVALWAVVIGVGTNFVADGSYAAGAALMAMTAFPVYCICLSIEWAVRERNR